MAFAPIPEYEGKSPYVFITYAQQDEKIAYSIAVKMYNEGFRIWSSAACGNPSNMRIAERLGNSEVAMVFLSKSYLKYASYREFEPRAVMNSPKKKIVICLDDTPLGTDWNTVDFPAGIRYNPHIPQELWLRINSSDTLEKCRGAWPKNPMPLPFEESGAINISVDDDDDISDELSSLNSVMASFGAGLDEQDIKNITLFQKNGKANNNRFNWPEKQERSQEQEYYAIENLIDNSPMPANAEKKQYDSMIGLIESFMEKSSRAKEEELQKVLNAPNEEPKPEPPAVSHPDNPYGYQPIPKNEFHKVDLSKDISSKPVIITESSDINSGMTPIIIDYGDDSEVSSYNMKRTGSRSARNSNVMYYPGDDSAAQRTDDIPASSNNEITHIEPTPPVAAAEPASVPANKEKTAQISEATFEKIVDDRKFMTSTEDNIADARLTYHLGALDAFDERNYVQNEPKYEPVDHTPVRFKDEDIPLPALSFDKPKLPEPAPQPAPEQRKGRRRCIVSVRTRIRRTEYESEMYEVNGRWIPSEMYHRLMPNAKYTMVRRISRPRQAEYSEPTPPPMPSPIYRAPSPRLNSNSRLFGAVNTFVTPPQRTSNSAETIPESLRSAVRERRETRRYEAIKQLEEESSAQTESSRTSYKNNTVQVEGDNSPARKYRFSHEGGIKKSLMANMETPVDTDIEESHRQYGSRAELAASNDGKLADKKSEANNEWYEKQKEEQKASKKSAQKAAEKAARKEAQKKAARMRAEEEKKNKKKKQSKQSNEQEKSTSRQPSRLPQRTTPSVFPDVDDDSLIELPSGNLPKINYDPEAYRDMNLSEILFGVNVDNKSNKKKKKK